MSYDLLLNEDWQGLVERLGGAEALAESARATKAFVRPREVKSAVELLRLVLAYCLGKQGLRLTAAWAAAVGLADLSNVALRRRLRQCGECAAGEPRPADPHPRCADSAQSGGTGQAGQRRVARPQRLRLAERALWRL